MSGLSAQPFVQVFGAGAPGASVPSSAVYFDTSTTPYTEYNHNAGAWHIVGANSAGNNAIQFQGVAVDPTPPINGQVLQLQSGVYAPVTVSGGTTPTVVQNGTVYVAAHSTGITLAGAPASGNLLVALVSDKTSQPTASAGWNTMSRLIKSGDGYGIFWKIAGAGESATQTPCSDANAGTISLYELHTAIPSVFEAPDFSAATVTNQTLLNARSSGGLIIGTFVNTSGTVAPVLSGTNVTSDAAQSNVGGARTSANFHVTGAVQINNVVTATYSTAQSGQCIAIAIG
ncbi:MAG TPA: hypothetical protein VIY48_08035 [Candidatus Paceibacterota bacterium]